MMSGYINASDLTFAKFNDIFYPHECCVVENAVDTNGFSAMADAMTRYQRYAADIKDHQPDHHDYQFMKDEVLRGRINMPRFSRFAFNDDWHVTRWAAEKLIGSSLLPLLQKLIGTDNLILLEPSGRYKIANRPEAGLPFHQDALFLSDEIPFFVCWLPLVACGETSPSIEVIRLKLREVLPQQTPKTEFFKHLEISDEYIEKHYSAYKWAPVMQPSDILVFTGHTIHRTQTALPTMHHPRVSLDLRIINGDLLEKNGVPKRWKQMRYVSLRDMAVHTIEPNPDT